MALGSTLKAALVRIADALTTYAADQGWKPNEYRILFRRSQRWGRIRVLFLAKDFAGSSSHEMWARVWDAIEKELNSGPGIGYSVGLVVLDGNEVKQRGASAIPPGYLDSKEVLL